VFVAVQLLAPLFLLLAVGAAPAVAAPLETQDPVTEVITARFNFNGTEGSSYNATNAGPGGLMLGTVAGTLTVGSGDWACTRAM
jgi:hypothetical protein